MQNRCLAAAATLSQVMEHQGNAAANQVTLPALTPYHLGIHLPECMTMSDTDLFHVPESDTDIYHSCMRQLQKAIGGLMCHWCVKGQSLVAADSFCMHNSITTSRGCTGPHCLALTFQKWAAVTGSLWAC